MAKQGCKLPQGLQWVTGSPYIWFDFSHEGNRFRGSCKTVSLKLAKERLTVERNRVVTGDYKKELPQLSLDAAFGRYWLERAQFNKTALSSIRPHILFFLQYFGKQKPLQDIGQAELSACVAECRTEKYSRKRYSHKEQKMVDGKEGNEKRLSPATINKRLMTFQGMHTMARDTWKVQVQPIKFADLKLEERSAQMNTLTAEEADAFIDAAEPHYKDFVMFNLYTGLRKGNILTMKGGQIDIHAKTITVMQKSRKAEGKLHVVPIFDALLHYIIAHDIHLREYVITYKGQPVRDIKTAHKTALKNAAITKKVRIHDLRHTCGTWLLQKTGDLKIVKDQLGHADFKTTERYVHTTIDDTRERVNKAGLPSIGKQIKAVK